MLVPGTYYLEVSGLEGDLLTLPASFGLFAQTCPTHDLASGVTGGTFSDDDCKLEGGTPYDVYTVSGPVNSVASLLLPDNDCSAVTLSSGITIPNDDACIATYLPLPIAEAGTTAVIVSAFAADQRDAYTITYSNCPLITVADVVTTGEITGDDCIDANGSQSDYYLVRAAADRVLAVLPDGTLSGSATASFPAQVTTTDRSGPLVNDGLKFDQDPTQAIPYITAPPCQPGSGNTPCAGFLIELSATSGMGPYQIDVDPLP